MIHKPDAVELKPLTNELREAAWKKRFPGYQASIEGYLDSDCAPSPANYAAIERKRSFDEDFNIGYEAGQQGIERITKICEFMGVELLPGGSWQYKPNQVKRYVDAKVQEELAAVTTELDALRREVEAGKACIKTLKALRPFLDELHIEAFGSDGDEGGSWPILGEFKHHVDRELAALEGESR